MPALTDLLAELGHLAQEEQHPDINNAEVYGRLRG